MKKIILFILVASLFGESLKVGTDLSRENLIQFLDQHGNLQTIPKETKYLLFARDMEASKIAHSYLLNLGQNGLNSKKLAFLADIHKMPRLITKMIALPKMKEYPYTIHLIQDELRGSYFPNEKGKLSLLFLESYKILKIEQVSTQEELEKLIQ